MPPARHRRPSPLAVAALSLALPAATPPARAADPTPPAVATAPAPAPELARLFKFHAGAQAQALLDAVERSRLDETSRLELRLLVREHLRRVDEDAARAASGAPAAPPAAPDSPRASTPAPASRAPSTPAPAEPASPLDSLLDRATDLAADFNDRRIAAWLDEHPAAFAPVQEQIALAEAYERAAADEPEAVVRAARQAGLPADQEAALRRTVTEARDRLARANAADARRVREAEERAADTIPPPIGNPRDAAPAKPAESGPDASIPPRPAVPAPPPSPEAERFHLLDALAFVDAQTRAAAAGRDARAAAEKLLTAPEHRGAMDDEMLRWYESLAPADDLPPDEPAPADKSPDHHPAAPRSGQTGLP